MHEAVPRTDRRRLLTGGAAAAATAWIAPAVVTTSVAAAQASGCATGVNLVVNGDASAGVTGWTTVSPAPALTTSSAPSAAPAPPYFVAGSAANTVYRLAQVVDIDGACGGLSATLSGLLRQAQNNSQTTATLTWYTGAGATGSAIGTPVTITSTSTTFTAYSTTVTIPVGALSLRIVLSAGGHPGTPGGMDTISVVSS